MCMLFLNMFVEGHKSRTSSFFEGFFFLLLLIILLLLFYLKVSHDLTLPESFKYDQSQETDFNQFN